MTKKLKNLNFTRSCIASKVANASFLKMSKKGTKK